MEYIVNLNLSEYLLLFQILGVYLGVEFQTHPIMNIKRNIIFALESRKKNGVPIVENVPIRMRVIYASQRIEFTTGYRIDVAKWDSDKQRVKNGCTNKLKQSASEINADLLKYYAEIQNVFKEFEVQETMPTTQQLKDAFNLRMKNANEEQQEEAQISFWEVFDEFVKECGNQNNWTESTYEKFAAVKNHLKEFKEDVTFEYFDEFGLNEYINFLRDKKDMRNSTIGKQMGFLKWFLRWSFKKDYHQNIAYDTFKPKLKTTPKKVIFLTWEELNRLKDYQIPKDKQYLERVRDVFLFCCFTSLRYSDVRNLKRSDVKSDHIEVTTVKTADSLSIELNKYSKAILEKYKDIHFENHMALPVISNQKMNDYLKELGIRVKYLHSDIDTLERAEIIRDMRLDVFDVLVGINLLREGLDIPEITLVAILDADKEGFLRSETSLIQTIGRAARNSEGHVIMYADTITDSMRVAIEETNRRRQIQQKYNEEHGITPTTIKKAVRDLIAISKAAERNAASEEKDLESMSLKELNKLAKELQKKMHQAAAELNFEEAVVLRDRMLQVKTMLLELEGQEK